MSKFMEFTVNANGIESKVMLNLEHITGFEPAEEVGSYIFFVSLNEPYLVQASYQDIVNAMKSVSEIVSV